LIPVCKIETYTGGILDHTITDAMVSANTRERVTDAVGQFTIVLPSDTKYEDVALHDSVKIYFGYDTVPATPTFVGYVEKIEGTLSEHQGYTRKISGLALGEVLLRRLKCGHYSGTAASAIVTELATELGLGVGDIVAEASTPPLEIMNQTYFEAMQTLSDIWINAGTQLRKEFYVDPDNHLVYQNRPLQAGTVTLAIGSNIISYLVTRSLENVKNYVTVHGNWDELFASYMPPDENWTEPDASCTNWTAITGTLSRDGADMVQGLYSVKCASAGAGIAWDVRFHRNLRPEYAFVSGNARTITQSFSRIHYQQKGPSPSSANYVWLLAPDIANYYYRDPGHTNVWATYNIALPTTDTVGVWSTQGTPQANFITGIGFNCHANAAFDYRVDDLALQGGRFCYKTSDATSIAAYGERDLVAIDDSLQSNGQCEARAKTLLYQRKDPTTQVEILTTGNANLLIGDRLAVVLPRESINGNYDVTVVEHTFSSDGFFTKLTALGLDALGEASNRYTVSQSAIQELSRLKKAVRALTRDSRLTR